MKNHMKKFVKDTLKKYRNPKNSVIHILHDIQNEYNYLPEECLEVLSQSTRIPLSNIFSIATFYKAFSVEPKGKKLINVCVGTACYVRNSENLLKRFASELKLDGEGTTDDLKFTLSRVRCLGCCSLAPVVSINGKIYGNLTADKIKALLEKEGN
ncbi:MAG: NAD(P)H-dependent oxidoreductase subunit E [Candidatus Schekmanbacteria bacterium]|nr:MAG: NAD(P)H-dependent oxidoreductase subunit E [Candidatus Schekmanbacteria bacterium]